MAFDIKQFSRVTASANENAPRVFAYKSAADNAATIKGSGYFADKRNDLTTGDVIYIYSSDSKSQLLRVTSATGAVTTAQFAGDA